MSERVECWELPCGWIIGFYGYTSSTAAEWSDGVSESGMPVVEEENWYSCNAYLVYIG